AADESTKVGNDRDSAIESEILARQHYETCRDRLAELKEQIAGLEGQVSGRSRIEGAEDECPVCAQPLDDQAHEHLREVWQSETAPLEAVRLELEENARPAHEQAKQALEEAERSVKRLQQETGKLDKRREQLAGDASRAESQYNTAE